MKIDQDNIVGEVVAKDYRTAAIFRAHNIDFCCKGNRKIAEACDSSSTNLDTVINEINQLVDDNITGNNFNFKTWDLDLLIDYIEKYHHRYVNQTLPEIMVYLDKIVKVHGGNHKELSTINELFTESAHELRSHMRKEEMILFPYIRKLVLSKTYEPPSFGKLEYPIDMMKGEHDMEGERFRLISELSNQYEPPVDACATYRVAFALLKEFEEDLHLHIHVENNILFPRAIELEHTKASA